MKIENLIKNNQLKLGVEYGNKYGTFNGSKDKRLFLNNPNGEFGLESNFLDNKKVFIRDKRECSDKVLKRKLSICPENNIYLYDFVSRFIIKTTSNKPAKINSRFITHRSRNLYYQEEAKFASIPIDEDNYVTFKNLNQYKHKGFDEVIYIRDEKIEDGKYFVWIIHHRLISNSKNNVLIGCNRFYKGEIIMHKILPNFFKNPLYRIREKSLKNFPFMVINESNISNEMKLDIETVIEIENG